MENLMATAAPKKPRAPRKPGAKKTGPKPKPLPPPAPVKAKAVLPSRVAAQKKLKLAAQEKTFAKLHAKAATIGDPLHVKQKVMPIALKNPDRPLTEMQLMFVRHWAAGESILAASARAGYRDGGTYAYRLVKEPAILKIYEREKALYEASCQMTRKKVMDGFLEAADMARLQADPTAMVGAWREVGKMCGYYEPVRKRIDINVNGTITQKVERMDEDTLLKIIRGEIGTEIIEQEMREVTAEDDE